MSGFRSFRIVQFFNKHPMIKSSFQAGGLMCLGDLISQTVVEKTEKIELARTARFGFIGSCIIGPSLFKWYGMLERFIKLPNPAATAICKMSFDQLTFAPTFLYGFFWINGALQGFSKIEIKTNISTNYFDVLLANYQLWPAVQIINFYFIPLAQRVLFVQTVALAWNTYLAWKMNRRPEESPGAAQIADSIT